MIDSWEALLEQYDEILDIDGDVNVSGFTFAPSRILRECDHIAYRCGAIDYADSLHQDGEATDCEDWDDIWRLP